MILNAAVRAVPPAGVAQIVEVQVAEALHLIHLIVVATVFADNMVTMVRVFYLPVIQRLQNALLLVERQDTAIANLLTDWLPEHTPCMNVNSEIYVSPKKYPLLLRSGSLGFYTLPWQCLNFLPLPQGHGSLRETLPQVSGRFGSKGSLL